MWPPLKRIRTLTGAPERAFHSILEHDVIERNVFESYYESDGRCRQRNVRALFFPLQPPGGPASSTSPFDWIYNTSTEMGRSTGSLRHNLFRKSVQLIGG